MTPKQREAALREAAQEVTERWVNDRTALAGAIERLRAALGGDHE